MATPLLFIYLFRNELRFKNYIETPKILMFDLKCFQNKNTIFNFNNKYLICTYTHLFKIYRSNT